MSSQVTRHHSLLSTLFLCLLWTARVDAANILAIFPTASYSHQMPLLALPRALAEAGHNLTVITPNPFRTPIPNYTEIDISFSYNYWKGQSDDAEPLINLQGKQTGLKLMLDFVPGANKLTDVVLSSKPVQDFIKYLDAEKPKFDLVLYENLVHPAYTGFVHKLGHPPLIAMITLPLLCAWDLGEGNECNPTYVPDMVISTTNKMNFWERLYNIVIVVYIKWFYLHSHVFAVHDEMARKYFGPSCPSTQSMLQNRSLHLSTSSWLFEYARPVFPNTIHVGPLHIGTSKPLPKDLADWVQGAKKGIVYFSLGSNVKSALLPSTTRSAILAAFAKLPDYRFIWKWEDEKLEGCPSNVLLRKWLPQVDILAHPNIKLFITQGGMQSLQEGVHHEVPMLAIPFFGDQNYNVRIISRLGVGNFMEVEDITTDTLYNNMAAILFNDSYTKAVQRVSMLSKTQMMSPRDTAVWWVEYVLKAGGNVDHLKPDYFHMYWFQHLGLDVLLVLLSPILLVLYGVYRVLRKASSIFLRKKSKTKLKTK